MTKLKTNWIGTKGWIGGSAKRQPNRASVSLVASEMSGPQMKYYRNGTCRRIASIIIGPIAWFVFYSATGHKSERIHGLMRLFIIMLGIGAGSNMIIQNVDDHPPLSPYYWFVCPAQLFPLPAFATRGMSTAATQLLLSQYQNLISCISWIVLLVPPNYLNYPCRMDASDRIWLRHAQWKIFAHETWQT